MPLPVPNLDDRSFDQLVAEARALIIRSCPGWTDLSPSDPGMVVVDVFAYLTEVMLYRLNRLPEKAYVEFLNLIGVRLRPPAAAQATLRFHRETAGSDALAIPRGTRVTLGRPNATADAPVFTTVEAVTIAAGSTDADVVALHCDQMDAEDAGKGTGLPGQWVAAKRPPIIAPTTDGLDLLVGVEAQPSELGERVVAVEHDGRTYRIWREVSSFSNLGTDQFVYIADRTAGLITFAPAARMEQANGHLSDQPRALAEVPPAGRYICLWYRRGGGPAGNVTAGTLSVIKDPIQGVNLQVSNPEPATGGRAAETPENARVRGPQTLHSLESVITATDYELVATRTASGVARARAFTRAELWRFAQPGTVQVLLVPDLPDAERPAGRVTIAALQQHQTPEALGAVVSALEQRRPLGTVCQVDWAHYKPVQVSARIVVRREEDPDAVKGRVLERLNQTISPLPTPLNSTGWQFGQALRASNVYDIALREPGVRWIDRVKLKVESVPEIVGCVAADPFQESTWYAGSGGSLFRSLNNGDSWEQIGTFVEGEVDRIRPHAQVPGLLAVAVRTTDGTGSRVHTSHDSGETWDAEDHPFGFVVQDLAWVQRDNVPFLLLATDRGLYELALVTNGSAVPVIVDPANQSLPLYSIASAPDMSGPLSVAVASQNSGGVYLSTEGGRGGSFHNIALVGEDVRVLAVQYLGPRTFLWAGETVAGGDEGKGCWRWDLTGGQTWPTGWEAFGKGWTGGSVRSLAFLDSTVFAASHHAGALRLDSRTIDNSWQVPAIGSGLPLREREKFQFQTVESVATNPRWPGTVEAEVHQGAGSAEQAPTTIVMAGVKGHDPTSEAVELRGVFRSLDGGNAYQRVSQTEFVETVNLPETWLLCSGDHDITVESEHAAS